MKSILYTICIILCFVSCRTTKDIPEYRMESYPYFCSQQKNFKSKDGNIKYIDKGEGEVILLLHGVPTSSWLYRKMIPGLVKSGYRVIAPDMLGFGASDNPKGYDIYDQESHAKRILDLMSHLKIDQWTHVFHDAGGLWTWELCQKAPDKISHMVILNTIIYEEGFHPPIKMKPGVFSKFAMWMYRNGITTNRMLKSLFKVGLKENNLTKDEVAGYKIPLREGRTNGMYYFFSQTCNTFPDYSHIINDLKIPVTVIWGKHDEMLQWETQKERVMKSMKIIEKDVHYIDAKHFIQEEKPSLINKLIIDFIANN